MPVVTFTMPRHHDLVVIGEARYFLVRTGGQDVFLVNGVCPHRGGPLHLGEVDGTGAVVCPWHGRRVPLRSLIRRAIPLIVRGRQATAVVADACADNVAGAGDQARAHAPLRIAGTAPRGSCNTAQCP